MRPFATLLIASAGATLLSPFTPAPCPAAWQPEGVDLSRPRITFRPDDLATIQSRLEREPYIGLLEAMQRRIDQANGVDLDDHDRGRESTKARAAKDLAFQYSVDRTIVDGQVVAFPTESDRLLAGDRACELLVHMYTRSRLAIPPPLGGWDRDITTSEELEQYATAFDLLLGAGYAFGADEAIITENIADLASELYENYIDPDTAGGFALLHQNNHRSKTGASLLVAGLVLAEYEVDPATDPRGVREPTAWIEYGLDLMDLILRYALVTGDGAYGEGPFYMRFTAENVLPALRAWDRLVDGATWEARGLQLPSLWRHPLFARNQRWVLDMTLPDGALAHIDDGNPGRSYFFGLTPPESPMAPHFAWRWANAPNHYESVGNIDVAAESIAIYDDTVVPAPPGGSPTAFYMEGGNAIFRSDWSDDAVVAIVLGEHDTASEFGRDRDGLAVAPESHEHPEPGAFMLHAYGEALALDPGYFSFTTKSLVDQPEHHNIVLVDGVGPVNYLRASVDWLADPAGRPPADGHATLSHAIDTEFIDAVRVTTRYGMAAGRDALIQRRFLFVADQYLVIADTATTKDGAPATFTWLLHGNGGGDSGGDFTATDTGGRWTRPAARLEAGFAFNQVPSFDTSEEIHESPGKVENTHTALRASATEETVRSIAFVYPSRNEGPPPAIVELDAESGIAALLLTDAAANRRSLAVHRKAYESSVIPDDLTIPASTSGLEELKTDGDFALIETVDGELRSAWTEASRWAATHITYGGITYARAVGGYGRYLGMRLEADRASFVTDAPTIAVRGLPFVPNAADGACSFEIEGDRITVELGASRHFTLRADGGNSRPGTGIVSYSFLSQPRELAFVDSASCDFDGDSLTHQWQLVSAPAGSAWSLEQTEDGETAYLYPDRPGPYRMQLVVTDEHGAVSNPVEALIVTGSRCADGVDSDLDGLIDTDDIDCDTGRGQLCLGDCNSDGEVAIAELIRAVRLALRLDLSDVCEAADRELDYRVTIAELTTAVRHALFGCPAR
jgi:hypothetical protein